MVAPSVSVWGVGIDSELWCEEKVGAIDDSFVHLIVCCQLYFYGKHGTYILLGQQQPLKERGVEWL